jgi:Protein of unknown function (DUF1559)
MGNEPSFWDRQFAVTKLEAVVIGIILLVLVALLMPNVEQSRGDARRAQCRHNLKEIELALHRYHDVYGEFPPAVRYGPEGGAWHSWRVLLMPYTGDQILGGVYEFDEPWDSPHNLAAAAEFPLPGHYRCPEDDAAFREKTTSYVAVVGGRTMWPPFGSVTRGTGGDDPAVTIQVVERIGSGIGWTEPRDFDFTDVRFDMQSLTAGPAAVRGGDAESMRIRGHQNVAFADGSARYLAPDTPAEGIRSMLVRDDGGPAAVD